MMKNIRFCAVITGVIGATCLLFAVIATTVTFVLPVSPPTRWIGLIAVEISVLTAVAVLGVIEFMVFLILHSRKHE